MAKRNFSGLKSADTKGFTSTPPGEPNSACRRRASWLALGHQHYG
jgi:hypothetical protein